MISNKYVGHNESWFMILTAQNKTTDGWYETGQKWIEWKGSNEAAIHELCDAGEYDVE